MNFYCKAIAVNVKLRTFVNSDFVRHNSVPAQYRFHGCDFHIYYFPTLIYHFYLTTRTQLKLFTFEISHNLLTIMHKLIRSNIYKSRGY